MIWVSQRSMNILNNVEVVPHSQQPPSSASEERGDRKYLWSPRFDTFELTTVHPPFDARN